ncbi:AAA family ATPase [Halapricum desulfuricans]|uniref:Chromosome segregation ATPase, Smc family n=1 Tax=Halapricum desulfuricans TaxID=2841257 RepID=A0A897P0H5_9EURY|nr:AAA family ATPase [Halapricum desulfuricans]QSG16329.1 Chromosome segregation ATPase, Smc family [Halapricum desulfuricans]
MTRDPICFEEVQIVQAPGFETGGFSVDDLCSGINVIHGPNAAGKTTLAESLEWLCWPETADERTSLVGQLSLNGESWRVEVDNGRANYQRDGQAANGPNLPPADQRDRYRLSLHDLLQRDNNNESFAKIIERESAGGYDLSAAYDELGYSDSPSRANRNVVQNAKGAIRELREARNDVSELRQEQNELSRLRSKLEAARHAQERAELLKQAIDYAQARNELAQAESRLDEFPDILDQVDDDEIERVRSIEADLDEWTKKKDDAEKTKTDAQERLAETDLPEDGLPTGRIDHLKALRDDLDAAGDRKRELEGDLADAERQRKTAREDIPLDVDTGDLVDLEPVTWKTVSKFAREAEALQSERETRDAVERLLEDGEQPEPDLPTLQRASQSLEEWLAASALTTSNDGSEAFRIAVFSAVSLASTGIALGLLVNPLLFSILLVAAGIFWYGLRARSQSVDGGDSQQPHREAFEKTGLEPPTMWSDDEVRSRLIELYDAIAAHKLAERRSEWRDSLATDRDSLEQQEQELEETRAELQDQLGAAPDASDVELAVISKRVLDWQEAHDEVEGLQESIDTVDEQIASAREQLHTKLAPYGYDDVQSSGEATETIRQLETREQQREAAQRDLDQATATMQEATEKIGALADERDAIFTALDLDSDDHDRLEELCEQVDAYESAVEEVRAAKIRADAAADELESYPDFEPDLKEQDIADLREDLREAERTAEEFDELQSRIADIRAEIRQAKSDDQVEMALAERDRALDDLKDQLQDDCAAMVGDVLVDHIQEATMETSRPDVFEQAREILATITCGRYRLDFDEAEAEFRVFDETKQKGLALDELSSGTRVQVLLAVRIAFVEQQEQGVQIPLLLDETLANTDDRRARTIIESTIELARNGRQVFYFTAQGDEVAKWTAALESTNGVTHKIIDLTTVRDVDESVYIPHIDSVESFTPKPPRPNGHDHASYGDELEVDSFNPHRGAGTAHLWYVIDDVDTLHQLLELGIEHWGQLKNLLQWGNGDLSSVDSDQITIVEKNAAALNEFVDAWKVGRGEPVDREILEASGAVSGTFIDEVSELAESVNGDGRQIVDALHNGEVNRFRSGKANKLKTYLEENGYIEPRETLDYGQIRARVIERYVDEGVSRDEATDRTDELLSRLGEA